MIPSFYIENFRLFERLEVNSLNRVNLFVGKNNSGKSAFLEAVYIYNNSASPRALLELIEGRQEFWEPQALDSPTALAKSPLKHLFNGHEIPALSQPGFRLGRGSDSGVIEVKTDAFLLEEADDRIIRRRIDPDKVDEFYNEPIEVKLVMESGGRTQILFVGDGSLRSLRRHRVGSSPNAQLTLFPSEKTECPTIFVPTRGISDSEAAAFWDMVNLTDLKQEVITALQVIEPNLAEIAFVNNAGSGAPVNRTPYEKDRLPMTKIEGFSEPIPLKSLGDGITQVFHMVLAMVNARNGTVLLDEFENGLHWSVQGRVWSILFDLAERLNVQVFATTHSRDCVEGYRDAWSDAEPLGAFFRLSRHGRNIEITPYDLETLDDSIETNVEVR